MEDLPIGAEVILKVVEIEKEECNGCFSNDICRDIYEIACGDLKCYAGERKDGKNVPFKRLK